jgi:hypothetical protein
MNLRNVLITKILKVLNPSNKPSSENSQNNVFRNFHPAQNVNSQINGYSMKYSKMYDTQKNIIQNRLSIDCSTSDESAKFSSQNSSRSIKHENLNLLNYVLPNFSITNPNHISHESISKIPIKQPSVNNIIEDPRKFYSESRTNNCKSMSKSTKDERSYKKLKFSNSEKSLKPYVNKLNSNGKISEDSELDMADENNNKILSKDETIEKIKKEKALILKIVIKVAEGEFRELFLKQKDDVAYVASKFILKENLKLEFIDPLCKIIERALEVLDLVINSPIQSKEIDMLSELYRDYKLIEEENVEEKESSISNWSCLSLIDESDDSKNEISNFNLNMTL